MFNFGKIKLYEKSVKWMRWKDENVLGTDWLKNFEKIKIELSKIVYYPFPDFGMHRYFWNDLWPGTFSLRKPFS